VIGTAIGPRVYQATGAGVEAVSPRRSLWATGAAAWRRHKDLLSNSGSLIAAAGLSSGLGFAFWTFAAREFSQQAVGYGSAAVSAMTLLGTIGVFGLGTVLIGELPRRNPRAGLVLAALLASGIGSVLLGLGFAVVAPLASKRFGDIVGEPAEAVIFAVGVALTAVASVFDQATIGLLRGGVQLSRNLAFAVSKMLMLPIVSIMIHDQFGVGIATSWVIGIAASLAGSAIWLRVRGSSILPRPDWHVLRALGKTAIAHNWLNIAIAVPVTLIPVVVTVVVSPSANAAFYIAWMLTGFLYAVPLSLSTVLFAVAAAEPRLIPQKLRFALKLSLLIGVPGMLMLCFGAHFALSLFGIGYAREATFPLWLLSLSYVPGLPKNFYIAVCRAAGRVSQAAVVLTSFAVVEIAAAGVGGRVDGLNGVSVAIFAVLFIEGLATTPAVFRATSGCGRHRRGGTLTPTASSNSGIGAYSERGRFDHVRSYPQARERPITCSETLCVCGAGLDCSAQANSSRQDRQTAGIAALMWLARSTAATVPFPAIPAIPAEPGRHLVQPHKPSDDPPPHR
jgi:O-antigen/teichoic acid export membrane protein